MIGGGREPAATSRRINAFQAARFDEPYCFEQTKWRVKSRPAGARVAAIDLDERGLETTRAELSELGPDHIVARCDTSSADSVTARVAQVERSETRGPRCGFRLAPSSLRGAQATKPLRSWN
jgi:hypothetical protein